MDIIAKLAEELRIRASQAEAAVKLIDEGNTIPFIARYRKEATGSLDDDILRDLGEKLEFYRALDSRRADVQRLIDEQGKLTPELAEADFSGGAGGHLPPLPPETAHARFGRRGSGAGPAGGPYAGAAARHGYRCRSGKVP